MAGEQLKQSKGHGERPGPHKAAEVEKRPAKRTQVGDLDNSQARANRRNP